MSSLKDEIKQALLKADFDKIAQLALRRNDRRVFTTLISLAYDKEEILCWRAIEAMGKAAGAVAERDPAIVRNIVQRLIWSMSEESGGVGWSAPEMLGEIVRNSPEAFADIPPIILSFQGEEMLLQGVLWAMGRIAEKDGGSVAGATELAMECLEHKDPSVRGLAVWALLRMNSAEDNDRLKGMVSDQAVFRVYEDGELQEKRIGDIVRPDDC